MSIFITGNSRDIQIIKSGITTYIPKKSAIVFTSGTEVGISYYGTGFSTTNEIIVLTYNAITSQTFSNSSAAAIYLQDLIDSDQKYSNSIMSFSGISVTGLSNSFVQNLSAGTLSANTLYSGTTNLYNIFSPLNSVSQISVRPGLNTYTGGTSTSPTVNVSALTISTLTASGNSVFTGTLSGGSSFSANTLYSGSTNLYSIFAGIGHTHEFSTILNTAHTHSVSEVVNLSSILDTKLNLSGGTMTGGLTTTSLSATTISGGTLYSGSTNLYNIFSPLNSVSQISVQPGLNTYTGGTSTNPTVNISAATLNNITITGITSLVSASTTYLQVNTTSASTISRERVIVYDEQMSSFSNVFVGIASALTYAQLNIRNLHNGSQASSDIIATADNGSETSNYIDMGINSSGFADYVGSANDGYLYSTGNDLWIGNVTSSKSIKLFTDGTGSTNVRVTITSASTRINNLSATTISATTIYSGSTDVGNMFAMRSYFQSAYMPLTQTSTSNVATTITGFSISLNAGEVWYINGTILASNSGTGGIAFTLSGTPGLWAMQSLAPSNSATAFRTNTYTGSNISSNTIISIANTILPFTYSGSISAATNGQFTIRYNSGTNGQTSRMHSGSTMTAMRVQ